MNKKLQKDIFENDINGNAFAILGAFAAQAKKEGWTAEERKVVSDEAMSGDYDNLLQTIMKYTD